MTRRPDNEPIPPNIAAYNDAIAGMYDEATVAGDWSVNDRITEVLRNHNVGMNPRVLDLGAGTGQTVDAILATVAVSRIVAVDASANMLGNLRRKYPSSVVKTVQARIEDYVSDNSETFDVITAAGSFEFVERLPSILGRLALLLRPGGLLAATYIRQEDMTTTEPERTFQVPSLGQAFTEYYWKQDEVNESLISQGLTVEDEDNFPAYQRGDEIVRYTLVSATRPIVRSR